MSQCRSASAMILVISMLVLMVTMSTAFMTNMSNQRGTAILTSARTRAQVGIDQAQNKIILQLIKSYTDTTPYTKRSSGSEGAAWYRDNLPVNNPDGDVWTDDGVPMGKGWDAFELDDLNIVNLDGIELPDMIGVTTNDNRLDFWGVLPGGYNLGSRTRARWHNLEFFDEHMLPIEMEDTLSESQKAELRAGARFVLRYAAQIVDYEGMINVNNNYPNAPIQPNPSDQTKYNRYQAYLKHFGRSIKSMHDTLGSFRGVGGYQGQRRHRSVIDPLDVEEAGYRADGTSFNVDNELKNDNRLKCEHAFRGDSMNWMENVQYRNENNNNEHFPTLATHIKGGGRLFTWAQIGRQNLGRNSWVHGAFKFAPFGGSLLGPELGGPNEVTVPWRLNYMSAVGPAVSRVFGSMTSHAKLSGRNSSTVDIFGPNYPEAFPLGIDDGRDIPLVGEVNLNAKSDLFAGGQIKLENNFVLGDGAFHNCYKHSFWSDILAAHVAVRKRVNQVWHSNKSEDRGGDAVFSVNNYAFQFENPYNSSDKANPSYILPGEINLDNMLNQLIRETCRVLGEGEIRAGTPATSWNQFNPSEQSLLGRGESFVGMGHTFGGGSNNRPLKRCRLSHAANTRAMEFALNDVLISLYGKANPFYSHQDHYSHKDQYQQIAVDFNNDGLAESTMTGWYNGETEERTWSWWCNGVGPFGQPTAEWMKYPSWIRFHESGDVQRKVGFQWLDLTPSEKTELQRIFDVWLDPEWVSGTTISPIKPFSHTGRFFMGKSKVFHVFSRCELYNIVDKSRLAAINRSFVYSIDPNDDKDLSDSHFVVRKEFEMKSTQD